ncbi:ABC transporter permease [Pengzhenrongella sp.]|jgi:glycine betaine/proline transport system permease protein|uniref:ABC transporter permease n=1 Tax=Pengzhenrongella sp. TaxID=2888820 RepID=UPI002F9446D8
MITAIADLPYRLPLGDWVESAVTEMTLSFDPFFGAIKTVLDAAYDTLSLVLTTPPAWAVVLVLVGLAFAVKGWKLALVTLVGFGLIVSVDQWENAMATLSLVIIASAIALAIAIPLGILAARNDRVSRALRPVLDFMQTMPAFVYLIPTVIIFLTGAVPGIVATIVFSLAPGVRFTELGIRQVDSEVVEAGHAFGASPGRILRQIQIPLALPTIMAGINQVIMLSLSMVVISGMVGAKGLGSDVVEALARVDVALGAEAGIGVVILAIYLDRMTSALADRAPVSRALKLAAA